MQAQGKLQQYSNQKHLQKVIKAYDKIILAKTRPFVDWYNITITLLNTTLVQKELLTIQEVKQIFNQESTFKDMLQKSELTYQIDNNRFVRRA